jgi:hypothetical protein
MPNVDHDVCAQQTVASGTTTITFVNHHNEVCTIDGLGNLVDCGNSFTVPAKSGSTPGTKTCNVLSTATPGTYDYTASCCGRKRTNPSIILQ